ncbi:MAG: PorT family protein [Bacteroidales bacterium]|nr:PorT family protein [Bacteroidales bacterium]MBN2699548.1 PorT family protein [Bacteroidales bacterium]
MKTKLLTLSTIFILSALALQAQIGIGFMAGVNFTNINGKDSNGDKLENSLLPGFHAGVNANIPVAPDFYFQPGILFSAKGAKNDFFTPPEPGDFTTTTRLSYIEMPLNLLYRPLLGQGFLLFGFGPYIAYGVTGKETSEYEAISYERSVIFNPTVANLNDLLENAYYRAFDAGGNIFFGYELSRGIFLQMNAQLGLRKINPKLDWVSDDKSSYRNIGYGFSLGYRF